MIVNLVLGCDRGRIRGRRGIGKEERERGGEIGNRAGERRAKGAVGGAGFDCRDCGRKLTNTAVGAELLGLAENAPSGKFW